MEEVHYRIFIMVNMSVLLCGYLVRRYMYMCDLICAGLHTGYYTYVEGVLYVCGGGTIHR